MEVQFLGPSFSGRSNAIDPSRCINFYPELNLNPAGKSKTSLIGTPGTSLIVDCGNGGPVRGLYEFGGVLYIVSGAEVFSWNGSSLAVVGVLATATGPVYIEDNGLTAYGVGGNQMMIADSVGGYVWNPVTSVFTQVALPNVPISLAFMDGYFLIAGANSQTIYASNLYDGTVWPGLAVGNAVSSTGTLTGITVYDELLFVFKDNCGEPWYDAGTPPVSLGMPFQKYQGIPINYGVVAPQSVAQGGDFLYCLGSDGSDVQVIGWSGYTPKPLLPPALANRVSRLPVVSDAIGFTYSDSGHMFYVLTFPTGNLTLVYDHTTQMWHERSTYSPNAPRRNPNRWAANCYCYFNGQHTVGDYQTGQVWAMGSQYYTDCGNPIISTRIAPIMHDKESCTDLYFYALYIDAEVGMGFNPVVTDTDTNMQIPIVGTPKAFLSWSIDGGYTWSNEYEAAMGQQGQYLTRLIWRRIGGSFNMVFDVTISDPIYKVLVNTFVDVSD